MASVEELERGRALCERGAWLDGHDALARADRSMDLQATDLERLAVCAYMLGHLQEYVEVMGRAHHLHLDGGAMREAARCAFWTGMLLLLAGEMGRGTGWIGRARRLVEDETETCVEQGYLRLPVAFRCEMEGDYDSGAAAAADAAAIAHRFGDRDLFALAMYVEGHMLVAVGRVAEGLALLDEAMVAVIAGEVSPIPSGIVYCGVILACRTAHEPGRAQEWTAALTRWCERQSDLVAFTGRCYAHRAELCQLHGEWSEALGEARIAVDRAGRGNHRSALAEAAYVQGELHRLRGAFLEAESAYRTASEHGRDPQPGLALLRLAQGDVQSAVDELEAIAHTGEAGVLPTIAAQTRGAVELAAGNAAAALPALRRAWRVWEDLEAPYEAARLRVLIAAACRELGDRGAAELELNAARHAFAALGATPDCGRVERLAGDDPRHGLTARELGGAPARRAGPHQPRDRRRTRPQ